MNMYQLLRLTQLAHCAVLTRKYMKGTFSQGSGVRLLFETVTSPTSVKCVTAIISRSARSDRSRRFYQEGTCVVQEPL
jgi:hypothetical protein